MGDDPTTNNFWGVLIHELREERKISQRRLADATDVNRATLRRIEEGTTRGDIDVIERLLNFMDYELEAMHKDALLEQARREGETKIDPVKRSKLAVLRLIGLNGQKFSLV
jgi:transcriptional regulator with XRE-family HTH domain